MALTVTVLGCSGSYAAADGACTGYLLRSDDATVWLDAGPGTLANLQTHIAVGAIDAVVLTHEHPDHWLEIPVFVNTLKFFEPPSSPVPIHLTAGTKHLFDQFHPDAEAPGGPVDLHVIDAESVVEIGDQIWRFRRTDHPVETLAVHVTSRGSRFAFSADSGPGWQLADFDEPIDLALVESSLPNRHDWPHVAHLTAVEAADRAVAAHADRLVLTHFPPGSDPEARRREAAEVFGKPVDIARVGATFTV